MKYFNRGQAPGLRPRFSSIALLAAAALGLGALTACGDAQSSGDGQVRIGLFASDLTGYTASVVSAAEQYAKDNGGTVQTFSANYDPQTQLQQCQDAVSSGRFTALIFYPVSGGALTPCVSAAQAAGIGVASVDTPLGPDANSTKMQLPGITSQVILTATRDGVAAAEMMKQACGDRDPCRVAYLLGEPAFAYSAERLKAIKSEIADQANIQIVSTGTGGLGTPDVAYTATKDVLTAHPDVNVIVNDDDVSATGIARAVDEAGRSKNVAVISGGGSSEGFDAVRNGKFFGTTYYMPQSATAKALGVMFEKLGGGNPAQVNFQVPELSPTKDIIVTKATVDELKPEWSASGDAS